MRSWLDPREATIVFTGPAPCVSSGPLALVWDEETGWRRGVFESGHQGIRTILSTATYLGSGVLPGHPELVNRLLSGADEPRRPYRRVTDLHDALLSPRVNGLNVYLGWVPWFPVGALVSFSGYQGRPYSA